ncbi:class I SAM-dependent methyltransferase [Echinicola sp. CAU 1574]|uniref:Class I SAM-dependent methyltransferase n=1 Tax=Echinicola arenosa TaxID=2774144 RepID=A0ABR9AQE1_9BACT|nr:class I SAM-dependent methyltransferase [Echinicola arenosa]MBD8491010.1 class I SAM-dependent methyltransferase [Echinicola arenosa]
MAPFNPKDHWENIYQTKKLQEVSWYQKKPETSLEFIQQTGLPLTAKIIDVGGGDSFLVDHLLKMGYQDITVLDIAHQAIERAKQRLGDQAKKVKWIVKDITNFQVIEAYDIWHDRAAFHFLTEEIDIQAYVYNASKSLKRNAYMMIGTFSEIGPKKCSGIAIKQYSAQTLTKRFKNDFVPLESQEIQHITPTGTIQHFVFGSFRKK